MKKYKKLVDIALLVGLAVLSVVAISPDSLGMPSQLEMLIMTIVLALIAVFLVLFWREKPSDERELENQAHASRFAYIIGCFVLIIALFIQSLNHEIDPAVPIALLAMIATKVIVQIKRDNP